MTDPYNFQDFFGYVGLFAIFILLFLSNKLLTIKEGFWIAYFLGIISIIIFFLPFKNKDTGPIHSILIQPIIILTLYKLMDNYIRKKYGRHMVFFYEWQLGTKTKTEQNWREFVFQMTLIIIFIIILFIPI
jgi:hypothetical protein